jgi:hypothetical protein
MGHPEGAVVIVVYYQKVESNSPIYRVRLASFVSVATGAIGPQATEIFF